MADVSAADVARLDQSDYFDGGWYQEFYPDVAASGLRAAEHYLMLGASLGRSPLPPGLPRPRVPAGEGGPDVLFIDGTGGSSSTVYRVDRIAAGLQQEGWAVRVLDEERLAEAIDADLSARFVVIHRALYRDPYPAFIAAMRARGAVIVYDIDDLLFDEALIPFVDAFRQLSADAQRHFRTVIHAHRSFILNADFCTASTSTIVAAIDALGKPAWRVRNAIAPHYLERFRTVDYRRSEPPKPFVVGYYSGTKTHQADFASVAPALARFMRDEPDVVFRLVGELDLEAYPELAQWAEPQRAGGAARITRVGLMPHDAMLRDQLVCDVILAPLEAGNPFCEAKSELKFFEAALTRCPVIASPTAPFREATRGGELALLARSSEEWLEALRRLHGDYAAARRQADRAFTAICTEFSQAAAAAEAMAAYRGFWEWREQRALLRLGEAKPASRQAELPQDR